MEPTSAQKAIINSILDKFKFEDDDKTKSNAKTAEQKKVDYLQSISDTIEGIAKQYQFQTDKELSTLLEGLADVESRGVTYWDYIEVDTLLSLQKGKTNFPDEVIFITYHQICELYFKLIIQELEKIALPEKHGIRFVDTNIVELWKTVLTRVVRYINKLTGSFDIMKDGLNNGQFGIFRKSLLPASGFQTYQFRLIEIMLTPYENLIMEAEKEAVKNETDFDKKFDHIYWRSGAIEKSTGKKAKILVNFNNKYDETFKEVINKIKGRTIYSEYLKLSAEIKTVLQPFMFALDQSILMWKLSHYSAATKHLPADSKGTGGTKWDEYLPVKNQKINYFPTIWEGKDFNSEVDKLMEELKTILK
jgi:tryptophan 2,3-dioxygenase